MRRSDPRARRRPSRDSGSVVAETVIILPALMVLLLVGMQFAVYALAGHAAELAVQEGGAAVRASLGGSVMGRQLALSDVRAIAAGLLDRPHVSILPGPNGTEELRLTAAVPTVLPGLDLHVSATSAGPRQEFRPG